MKKIIFSLFFITAVFVIENIPALFINNKKSCSNFNIYYSSKVDEDKICNTFESVLEKYNFINSGNVIDIYLTDSFLKYKFFSFFSKDAVRLNILRGFLVLSPADFEKREFVDMDVNFNEKINEAVLRYLLFNKYSPFEYIMIDEWKIKGYSKYVSNEIQEFTAEDVCNNQIKKNYINFENMIVVKYLIEEKRYRAENLFSDNISYDVYLKEVKSRYCR